MTARALEEAAGRALLVGLSATGYRCEGGFNGPGQPTNQWAAWERIGAVRAPADGCDLWRHPEPAVDLAAAAGVQVLAVGVEWARVEPSPGRVDDAALAHYAEILDLAARRGLLPVVTLHDVAHPQWLGEEFWLTPGAPDRFAEHAARVVARLAAHCRHWVTVRQPNHVALCGWVAGSHPPRRLAAVSDAWAALDNLSSAHVLAYDEIHRVQPDATVALGIRRAPSYDAHRLALDLLCAPQLGVERSAIDVWVDGRRAAHDVAVPPDDLAELAWRRAAGLTSPYGHRARGLRLSSPRRLLDVVYGRSGTEAPLDALWLVWRPRPVSSSSRSTGKGAGAGAGAGAGRHLAGDAAALEEWCTSELALVPGLPLWIEDGVAAPPDPQGADDRARHIRASLRAVSDARRAGAHVAAYVYHCLGPDTEPALSPPPWTPRFLAPAPSAPTVVAGAGAASTARASAADYGLFDVATSSDDSPQWRPRAGDALARLEDAARAAARDDRDPPTGDAVATGPTGPAGPGDRTDGPRAPGEGAGD